MINRQTLLLGVIIFSGFIVALGAAPYWIAPDASAPNAAARLGYNIDAAYLFTILWSVLAIAIAGFFLRGNAASVEPANPEKANNSKISRRLLMAEIAFVFAAIILIYFPVFLARYGDFIEDKYFLSALARMKCGDLPYTDFEFLYGPMMIYPAHYWVEVFGFSFKSYYAFLALLQGTFFATMLGVLQRYLPDWRMRYFAFIVLAAPLIDVLLGLNYIGWRRMLPVFALLMISARPLDVRFIAFSAGLLGLCLAYSYEYGMAGLAACGAVYGLMLFRGGRGRIVIAGAGLAIGSILAGILLAYGATGATFGAFLRSAQLVLKEAGEKGLGAFRFYWTAHSLALFGLFTLTILIIGKNIKTIPNSVASAGDRFLAGAIIYALVSLKIAFQRADIWHMASPFLALTLFYLLSPSMRIFPVSSSARKLSFCLIAVASTANIIGYLPLGMWVGRSVLTGAYDVVRGIPPAGPIESREFSVQSERTQPDARIIAMAAFLAADENKNRPVIFYKDRWWMNHHLGVCPTGYSFYDMMYANEIKPLDITLSENPETLVIMERSAYDRLFLGRDAGKTPRQLRVSEKLSSIFASVHYHQSPIEDEIEFGIWRENLGARLVEEFELRASFGPSVVLSRKDNLQERGNASP